MGIVGEHCLFDPVLIGPDQRIGHCHNLGSGPEVLVEREIPGPGILTVKADHVFHPGSPPAVDVLIVVPDDEKVVVFAGQKGQKLLLVFRHILKFVAEDILTVFLPGLQDLRVCPEEIEDHVDQVREIRQSVVPLTEQIEVKDPGEVVGCGIRQVFQGLLVRARDQGHIQSLVGQLVFLDLLQIFLGRDVLQIQSQLLRRPADQVCLIGGIDDGKGFGPVQAVGLLPEDHVAEAVEGPHKAAALISHQVPQPPSHGGGRLVCKGKTDDGGGIYIKLRDQVGDPAGQAEGLAGARHGRASLVSFRGFDHLLLFSGGF